MDSKFLRIAEICISRFSRYLPLRGLDYVEKHYEFARRVCEGERWPVARIRTSLSLIALQCIKFFAFYFGDFDHVTRRIWFDMFHIDKMPATYNLAIAFLLFMVWYYVWAAHYVVHRNWSMQVVHRVAVHGDSEIFFGPQSVRTNAMLATRRFVLFLSNYMAMFRIIYFAFVAMVQFRLTMYFVKSTPPLEHIVCMQANTALFFVWSYYFVEITGISATVGVTSAAIIRTRYRQCYALIRFDNPHHLRNGAHVAPTAFELRRFYRQHTHNLSLLRSFDRINWLTFVSYIAGNIPLNSLMATHLFWRRNPITHIIFMCGTMSGQFLGFFLFHVMAAQFPPLVHRPSGVLIRIDINLSGGGIGGCGSGRDNGRGPANNTRATHRIGSSVSAESFGFSKNLSPNYFSYGNNRSNQRPNNARTAGAPRRRHTSIHEKLKLANYIGKFCTRNQYGLGYGPGFGIATIASFFTFINYYTQLFMFTSELFF